MHSHLQMQEHGIIKARSQSTPSFNEFQASNGAHYPFCAWGQGKTALIIGKWPSSKCTTSTCSVTVHLLSSGDKLAAAMMLTAHGGVVQTVASFLTPPSHFFKPVVVRQVLAHLLAQKWAAASSAVRCLLMATSLLMAAVVFSPFLRVRA